MGLPPWAISVAASALKTCTAHPGLAGLVVFVAIGAGIGVVEADTKAEHAAQRAEEAVTLGTTNAQAIADINTKLNGLVRDTTDLKLTTLRAQLRDAARGQCRAGNYEGRLYYQQQLDELKARYQDITHTNYDVPNCSVFAE